MPIPVGFSGFCRLHHLASVRGSSIDEAHFDPSKMLTTPVTASEVELQAPDRPRLLQVADHEPVGFPGVIFPMQNKVPTIRERHEEHVMGDRRFA